MYYDYDYECECECDLENDFMCEKCKNDCCYFCGMYFETKDMI